MKQKHMRFTRWVSLSRRLQLLNDILPSHDCFMCSAGGWEGNTLVLQWRYWPVPFWWVRWDSRQEEGHSKTLAWRICTAALRLSVFLDAQLEEHERPRKPHKGQARSKVIFCRNCPFPCFSALPLAPNISVHIFWSRDTSCSIKIQANWHGRINLCNRCNFLNLKFSLSMRTRSSSQFTCSQF